MSEDEEHGHGEHSLEHGHGEHSHEHGHGHARDQGLLGMLRYLRHAPEMWRSEMNDAVVDLVAPEVGERVLDIGAGMGAGTVVAAGRGAIVIAVEPTPFMRRVLTMRRLAHRSRSLIEIEAGSAEQVPAADASIDAVWAVNTMHHWIDPDRGAAEIARVLKPGGRVILIDENFTDPTHPDYERFGSKHADDDGHHHGFTMVDAAEMGDRLRANGLTNVDAAEQKVAGRPSTVVTVNASAG